MGRDCVFFLHTCVDDLDGESGVVQDRGLARAFSIPMDANDKRRGTVGWLLWLPSC